MWRSFFGSCHRLAPERRLRLEMSSLSPSSAQLGCASKAQSAVGSCSSTQRSAITCCDARPVPLRTLAAPSLHQFFPPALGIRVCLCLRACIFMCLYLYLAVGVLSHLYALTHVCSLSACASMNSQIESLIRPLSRSFMSHSHQLKCVTVSLLACWHPLTCFLAGWFVCE